MLCETKWRLWHWKSLGGFGASLISHLGGRLGNVATYANGGGEVHFGWRLLTNFGSCPIRPGCGFQRCRRYQSDNIRFLASPEHLPVCHHGWALGDPRHFSGRQHLQRRRNRCGKGAAGGRLIWSVWCLSINGSGPVTAMCFEPNNSKNRTRISYSALLPLAGCFNPERGFFIDGGRSLWIQRLAAGFRDAGGGGAAPMQVLSTAMIDVCRRGR